MAYLFSKMSDIIFSSDQYAPLAMLFLVSLLATLTLLMDKILDKKRGVALEISKIELEFYGSLKKDTQVTLKVQNTFAPQSLALEKDGELIEVSYNKDNQENTMVFEVNEGETYLLSLIGESSKFSSIEVVSNYENIRVPLPNKKVKINLQNPQELAY